MENLVERTDFVSVPVQDMERAKGFYRDVLGMHSPDWEAGFPEIETGNVSLYPHGVPRFPDPTSEGLRIAPSSGTDLTSPPFRAAEKSCQKDNLTLAQGS